MPTAQTYVAFRPDIWAPYIDQIFRSKLVCAKFFSDWSDYVTEGGKSIVIPRGAAFTATAITTTTGDITGNLVSDTNVRLDITLWYGNAQVFADFQIAQIAKNYRVKEQKAQDIAYTLAKALDSSIIGLFTGAYPSRVVNASTAGLKASDLEQALAIIESYDIPREECAWFFHPLAYFQEILAVRNFLSRLWKRFQIETSLKLGEILSALQRTIPSQALLTGKV